MVGADATLSPDFVAKAPKYLSDISGDPNGDFVGRRSPFTKGDKRLCR